MTLSTAKLRSLGERKMNGHVAGLIQWFWQGGTGVIKENPVALKPCPPNIPHCYFLEITRASSWGGGQQITVWSMTRLSKSYKFSQTSYKCENYITNTYFNLLNIVNATEFCRLYYYYSYYYCYSCVSGMSAGMNVWTPEYKYQSL